MRIKFINPTAGIGLAYHPGEEANLPNALAQELINDGFAQALLPKIEIPYDFPGRAVFIDHGFQSLQEIKELASIEILTAYQGIGKTIAQRVIKYLKNH